MFISFEDYLKDVAADPSLKQVAETIARLSEAAIEVQRAISVGRITKTTHGDNSGQNASGETQKALDVFADEAFLRAAKSSHVLVYGSEEQDVPVVFDAGSLALAIDPLDGSSNIETNISVGTVFSLLPVHASHKEAPAEAFQQLGKNQLAAGFFIYGAQLLLVMTVGAGTRTFIHIAEQGGFFLLNEMNIPVTSREYSVNASNRRYWSSGIARYIKDVEAGEDGPRGRNFGMRYVGSLVAEAYRILQRGGVFLYPADQRAGYHEGRLRQLYEANPIAFCIEQAGGSATDGTTRILNLAPKDLHARTPLVFGSQSEVETIAEYIHVRSA
ncbi:class 1 fructose-bisphosphatase [Phyllobacterium sp. SB3]|uniref:class 1 fructose-bisphosphatase n=1 Tax=Phyllobacterium sp. SB3 TaxID=3156073 RepID=UPI0032AEDCB7